MTSGEQRGTFEYGQGIRWDEQYMYMHRKNQKGSLTDVLTTLSSGQQEHSSFIFLVLFTCIF